MKNLRMIQSVAALLLCSTVFAAFEKSGDAATSARQKLQKKDYAGAREDATAAINLAKTPADRSAALLLMGQILEGSGDLKAARTEYEKVASDAQSSSAQKADACNKIGGTWLTEKKYDAARAEYARALALPDLPSFSKANLLISVARSYEREENWPAARAEFAKCLEIEKVPDSARFNALSGIAGGFRKEKNAPEMKKTIDAALQISVPAYQKCTLLKDYALFAAERNDSADCLSAWKRIVDLPDAPARNYMEAVSKALDLLADQRAMDDARTLAEKAAADARLTGADKLLAGCIAAGFSAISKPDALKAEVEKLAAGLPEADATVEKRLKACQDAGRFFVRSQQYAVARQFVAMVDALHRPAPKNAYTCEYMPSAPTGVGAWMASEIVKDPRKREARFAPYDRKSADLLINDVRSERTAAETTVDAGKETAFFMAWDDVGWHIFVECEDPEAAKVAAGLLGGGQLEMSFMHGLGECYYQWLVSIPDGKVNAIDWNSPHRGWRPMDQYYRSETLALDKGFGTYVFFPWEFLYDRLPKDGDAWPFGLIRWTRAGGVTWGGLVHETHKWGTVQWSGFTPERRTAIKRRIAMKALGSYQKARTDAVNFWKDEELGDPAFYAAALAPAVAALDEAGKKVGEQMTAADVDLVCEQTVPDWMEFQYKVSELRQEYLKRRLFDAAKP